MLQNNLVPTETETWNLGATALRWQEIYMGPGTLNIAGPGTAVAKLGADDNAILYAELGFATPFINIGPAADDAIEPGAIGGWQVAPTGTLATTG
jgi:hypothetical protein